MNFKFILSPILAGATLSEVHGSPVPFQRHRRRVIFAQQSVKTLLVGVMFELINGWIENIGEKPLGMNPFTEGDRTLDD